MGERSSPRAPYIAQSGVRAGWRLLFSRPSRANVLRQGSACRSRSRRSIYSRPRPLPSRDLPVNVLTHRDRHTHLRGAAAAGLDRPVRATGQRVPDYNQLRLRASTLKRSSASLSSAGDSAPLFSSLALAFVIMAFRSKLSSPLSSPRRSDPRHARGTYSKLNRGEGRDEFGVLTQSFNIRLRAKKMPTHRGRGRQPEHLENPRPISRASSSNLTSGVLTFDDERLTSRR